MVLSPQPAAQSWKSNSKRSCASIWINTPADLIARGHDPEEARRQAHLAVGGPEQMKEECRDARGTRWIEDLWQDFRYAVRTLRHRPGFTAVAVITLALGIGASTAIFSAVNPILFEPLPYPHADRVMMLWDYGPEGSRAIRDIRKLSRTGGAKPILRSDGGVQSLAADDDRCRHSRTFRRATRQRELLPSARRAAAAWPGFRCIRRPRERSEGGDPQLHGCGSGVSTVIRQLWGVKLSSTTPSLQVAGVMPQSFENVLAPSAELWAPLQYDATLPLDGREWGHHLRMVGRLRPGVESAQAQREIDTIARTPVREFTRAPWAAMKRGLILNSLQEDVTRGVRPALLAVLGAVLLLLMIACVNVTNLLLAQGAQRRGEFAMRAALGAGRMRMIRQLLTESLLLAALGGGLGMLVANFGVAALVTLSPAGLPRVNAIRVDANVFAFALGVTALIGLVIGLVPAIQAYREDLRSACGRIPGAPPEVTSKHGDVGDRRSCAGAGVAGERRTSAAKHGTGVRRFAWFHRFAFTHDAGANSQPPIRRRSSQSPVLRASVASRSRSSRC